MGVEARAPGANQHRLPARRRAQLNRAATHLVRVDRSGLGLGLGLRVRVRVGVRVRVRV